ncbi:MAG TPA: hypothetical protein VGM56_16600 [Byssovorax sp.]
MHKTLSFVGAALLLLGCGDNLTHPDPDHPEVGSGGAGGGGGAGAFSCIPNLDGQIDAAELAAVYNVPVTYLVNPPSDPRTVDLQGTMGSNGLEWDFSQDYADDESFTLTAIEVTSAWYASSFPTGQFATPLDVRETLDGVYSADDAGIYLLGIASHAEMPSSGQTLLVYDAPIAVYRFPLAPGATWVSTGNVRNGTIDGLPYSGKDVYEISDDAIGQLALRDFTFQQAHRVRTHVTSSPAVGASQEHWQVGFVFECFGEVTRATSAVGDMSEDFTSAAELRRLGQ